MEGPAKRQTPSSLNWRPGESGKMPDYVVERQVSALNQQQQGGQRAPTVLVLGMAFQGRIVDGHSRVAKALSSSKKTRTFSGGRTSDYNDPPWPPHIKNAGGPSSPDARASHLTARGTGPSPTACGSPPHHKVYDWETDRGGGPERTKLNRRYPRPPFRGVQRPQRSHHRRLSIGH